MKVLIAAVVLLLPLISFGAVAEHWPDAWFLPMKTASEVGIIEFHQSPMLSDRTLPPVADRLPSDPPVVVPLHDIGKYGGTVRTTRDEWLTFPNVESPMTISADMRTVLPNLAESWVLSPDGRRLTLTLREGIRWSDGVPLTSDDFLFVLNDLWLNKEWAPVTNRLVRGARAVRVSDRTFYYEFPEPSPLFVFWLAQYGNFMLAPKHFYRRFHPSYVDREDLNARMKEMGFITWMTFINACRRQNIEESADAPTLDAHRVVSRSPTVVRFERNPYYFKVDPAGNQLPYIDAIESRFIDDKQVIAAMTGTGQLDFSAYELKTQDIPLLKLGEQAGVIKVNIWNRLHSSDVVIQMNFNYPDQRLADIFLDRRFREAMSIAINRDEMNEIIYFGRGTPRQVTAHPSSRLFEPHFASAHTQYDPEQARRLLDEVGLFDQNNDGLREFQDGTPLVITLEYIDWETPKEINLELVSQYWREVGIDLRLKVVDRSLQSARAQANQMQMT
ncbi:MAG: ABC transporter substrate-binding protein, partial [Pseudomonadota bacterium]